MFIKSYILVTHTNVFMVECYVIWDCLLNDLVEAKLGKRVSGTHSPYILPFHMFESFHNKFFKANSIEKQISLFAFSVDHSHVLCFKSQICESKLISHKKLPECAENTLIKIKSGLNTWENVRRSA